MKLSRSSRVVLALVLVLTLVPLPALAQQEQKKKKKKKADASTAVVVEVVEMFESNELEALVAAVEEAKAGGAEVNGDALYVQGLAQEKLGRSGAARSAYAGLAERPESEAWHWVGKSATSLLEGDTQGALTSANRALELEPRNELGHYQRGLVLVKRADYAGAAQAFTQMLEIDGDFAYGHYYAGMSYHQQRNLMAAGNHLRRFLELAPQAPEKLQVQSILATISG